MTLPTEINPAHLASTGYTISRSVRTRGSALGNFTRNLAGASATTWTLSYWFKTGMYSSTQTVPSMFDQVETTGLGRQIGIRSDSGCLSISKYAPTTYTCRKVTAQVFRDPSAWYHVVVVWNTTVATAEDRVQIYVNGSRVTSWTVNTIPAQNETWIWTYFTNSMLGQQNRDGSAYAMFDGYLAEVNFIDGQALTASSFGVTDSNGIWQPKAYTGTYGTNGFYLKFTDNSAATATTIGKDYSGNGNNWTPNNISVTAGVTYDSMLDSPTNSVGASNYCVLNKINTVSATSGVVTITNANLTMNMNSNGNGAYYGTIASTAGAFYFEVTITAQVAGADGYTGIVDFSGATVSGFANSLYRVDGTIFNGTGWSAYGATYGTGDRIGVAYDLTNNTITFYKNNVSQGQKTITSGKLATPAGYISYSSPSIQWDFNFGQQPFFYTVPTGYKSLNTYNLPAATINNGGNYFNIAIATGANLSTAINSLAPAKDFRWVKNRTTAGTGHVLWDSIRGSTARLDSSALTAETTFDYSNLVQADNHVGWVWQAGQGVISTNTNGSITSNVSVNQSAGFSVVTWTATNAAATVGHGLGVAPKMIFVKDRSSSANWVVYHASIANTSGMVLNSTSAAGTSINYWNNTSPTTSVFSVGTYSNYLTDAHVAYCWAEVAGYSKFGSYTGNGAADGPFVYCGFRPRFILIKDITIGTTNWIIHDTSRDTYNQAVNSLAPNATSAEAVYASSYGLDVTANGFKIRLAGSPINTSADTHIFAAFAENPFNISRAR